MKLSEGTNMNLAIYCLLQFFYLHFSLIVSVMGDQGLDL